MLQPPFGDPSLIDASLDCRAVTFENPSGSRGAGGTEAGGRKGAPSRTLAPGERMLLADLEGPGRVTHLWMTFPPCPPEQMRALWMQVFYDGRDEPSVSVPCLDFFGLPHGRPVPYTSSLTAAQEGRGFNSYLPMPFQEGFRLEVTNSSDRELELYFQIDYLLAPVEPSYLHVSWRRDNPTTMGRDFVIAEGLRGPGRFLGCNVGIRVLDEGIWYGEGEVKVFRDGDTDHPTICGTGLEDYVGSAWGMWQHHALYAGAPIDVREGPGQIQPDFVGFYRWHVLDPIMFERELEVRIQQIGAAFFFGGQEEQFEDFEASHPVAGLGWSRSEGMVAHGIVERVDDYCATAYVYATEPQAVPRLDVSTATADIARRSHEQPGWMETLMAPRHSELFRPRPTG